MGKCTTIVNGAWDRDIHKICFNYTTNRADAAPIKSTAVWLFCSIALRHGGFNAF